MQNYRIQRLYPKTEAVLQATAVKAIFAYQAQEPDLQLKSMDLVQVGMEVRVTTVLQTRLQDSPCWKAQEAALQATVVRGITAFRLSDFEAEQKRVNREYENKLKWSEIRNRNLFK